MTLEEIKSEVRLGEDSRRQFKADVRNADSLAADLVAFSNSAGGTILIGVGDGDDIPGLVSADVRRVNQLIGNAATQHMRSPISPVTENVEVAAGRIVIVARVPEGLDKPYFDRQGVIWIKAGSDKRRIQSKEELRRLFQFTDQFHADEVPTKAGLEELDKLRFREFLQDVHGMELPEAGDAQLRLLQNLSLASDEGKLNLAGVLLFAERPQRFKPQFTLKAIRYPGATIHETSYLDTEDCEGTLSDIFEDGLGFVMRNLHKIQAGRGVNAPGTPEVPRSVFEELLVNALVHRDYLVSAPIRLFIFDDRIEIISPGHLPNNLTVDRIRAGTSIIRNPILVSFAAKGMLPYHGLGSGIKRALSAWSEIDFRDDRDGNQFVATVGRPPVSELTLAQPSSQGDKTVGKGGKTSGKTGPDVGKGPELSGKTDESVGKDRSISRRILEIVGADGSVTIPQLSEQLGITERSVQRHIQKLQRSGALRRIGGRKKGRWEVLQ